MAANKIFVGSVPEGLGVEQLLELFSEYGQVNDVVLKAELRYAFIIYGTAEEAKAACALNGHILPSCPQPLVVKLADRRLPNGQRVAAGQADFATQPVANGHAGLPRVIPAIATQGPGPLAAARDRIYVKGLPAGLNEVGVREIFDFYGVVQDCKVLVSDGKTDDGLGQTVAIVRLSQEEADWLVTNLNGNIPQGLQRPVEVSHAGAQRNSLGRSGDGGGGRMVGGDSWGLRAAPYGGPRSIRQAQVTAPFPPVARAQDVALHLPPLPPPAKVAWRGSVTPAAAGGFPFHAPFRTLAPGAEALLASVTPGCKLYVKGIPVGSDNEYLYGIFGPFGRVLEASVIDKGSFAIGFVTYVTEAEALEGVMRVNGAALSDGVVLQVSIKTNRQQ